MTEFVFKNFSKGFLIQDLSSSGLDAYVDVIESGTFAQPTGSQVQRCIIEDDSQEPEIVDVTSNALTGALTLNRALEGTAAKEWPSGSKISAYISAGVLTELEALK